MSELEYRCTHCGAVNDIEEETNEYFICGCCGTKVIKKRSEELIANIKKLNLEKEAYELANYRKLLRKSLENKNIEFQNDIATKILSLIPTDFEASFYSKFINRIKYPRDYVLFLSQVYQDYSINDVEPLFDFIISNARHDEVDAINTIISKLGFDSSYLEKIEKRKREIETELDLYANIDRDVFICHSSKDTKLLHDVIYNLEDINGFYTWYSERNMPWDPINYWANIKEAIKNCKVFLILITENSKFSQDVKKELSFAKELGKDLRVGYLGEETNPGIEIKRFLSEYNRDTIKYSDEDSLNILSETIYDLIENSKNNKIETKPIIEIKQVIKEEPVRQETNETENNELDKNIKRAFLFLEDEEWDKADQRLELILDNDPTNGEAYLGKLLLEAKCNSIESLIKVDIDLASLKNYNKVLRFGSKELKQKLEDIVTKQALLKAKAAEQKRKEEKVKAEQEALRKKQEEEKRLEEERQRKLQEEKKALELKKIEELNKALEEQKRIAELKEQEEKRQAELKKRKEEKRLAEEKKLAELIEIEEKKRQEELRKRPYLENGKTYIDIGKYPQTHVNDSKLIVKLNSLKTTNSNGYYEYEGCEYCKVTATPDGTKHTYSDGTNVTSGTAWFKVEPVKWRVLYTSNNEYTLLSEYLLIAKRFDDNSKSYSSSEIRTYLTGDFYSQAFTTKEKILIQSNKNVNNDNVWLLSQSEVCNTTYGFNSNKLNNDTNRKSKPTDYSLATGAWYNSENDAGSWWLRTPRSSYSYIEYVVSDYGNANCYEAIYYTSLCARPAIIVKIDEDEKTLTKKIDTTEINKPELTKSDNNVKEEIKSNPSLNITTYKENGNTYINLGKFPQTHVNDSRIIIKLNKMTSTNSNGYYELDGSEYYKINANPYENKYHYSDRTSVIKGKVWFKVEPIKWRVLEQKGDTYTLLSEYLLLAKRLNDKLNGYTTTELRNYLIKDFYYNVFTDNEQNLIKSNISVNNDKIWLLSRDEVKNAGYGFNSDLSNYDIKRRAEATDYALASGAKYDNDYYRGGNWWLRTPYTVIYNQCYVKNTGTADSNYDANNTSFCIRPAIIVQIKK